MCVRMHVHHACMHACAYRQRGDGAEGVAKLGAALLV